MSTRYNNGSHYENHQRAAELHDLAAHAHRAGEQHGKQDHLTGHEHSRQALEHSEEAHRHTQAVKTGHGLPFLSKEEIAGRAHVEDQEPLVDEPGSEARVLARNELTSPDSEAAKGR